MFFTIVSNLLRERLLFLTGLGTYLLVMNGLPEEGTEWEKRVSFMLVTGLGGLEQNTMWVKKLRQSNEFKLPTIQGGGRTGISVVSSPRSTGKLVYANRVILVV